jgi:prephenate dehydrogenase
MALALRKCGFGDRFIGVDNSETHRSDALWLGIVDEALPIETAVPQSDVVVLSIPVDIARTTLPQILDLVGDDTLVVDTGSTKQGICAACRTHPRRAQFVASHPIAGTEFSGPKAAIDTLFANKKMIVCDRELCSPQSLRRATDMYEALGMEISYMSSEMHDRHIAFVSHISHISSFALGAAVLNIEKDEKSIFTMAGSGFSSTVRLAKSSPDTWAPIFVQNADSILFALDDYIAQLEKFRDTVARRDVEQLKSLIRNANDIRRILE